MKKFSKIFLVLLTLSLILSTIFTVAASAATEESREMLNVTTPTQVNGTRNVYTDFETTANATGTYGNLSGQNGPAIKKVYVSAENGNHYYRWENNGTMSGTGGGEMYYQMTGWSRSTSGYRNGDMSDFDYAVIDFEIATDKYVYKLNGKYHTAEKLEDIPKDADPDSIDLAFFNGMGFNLHCRADASASAYANGKEVYSNMLIHTVKDPETGDWYVDHSKTYSADSTTKIRLSNEIGVFDHITYVIQTVRAPKTGSSASDISGSKFYAFVNGEFLFSGSMGIPAGYEVNNLAWMRFAFGSDQFADKYAICVDNFAINWYDKGYVSENFYGVDDFILSGDYTSKPLYYCDEVVYGVNYSFVGSRVAVALEHIDGTTSNYANPISAAANIQSGDFVHMYANFVDFMPSSSDVEEVTFISYDGTTLKLSDEANQFYKLQHTGDRYTIRRANSGIKLTWYSSQDIDAREVVKEHFIIPYIAPTNSSDVLQIVGDVKYAESGATIEVLEEWMWDKNGDGIGDSNLDAIFKAHSVEELNKLMENGVDGVGISKVDIVPVFKELTLCYALLPIDASENSATPDFIVDDYDFESFTTFDTLASAVKKANSEMPVKVVLYSDYAMPYGAVLTIPESSTVNFNLNGHSITSSGNVFSISEGSIFNLYSSVAGGNISSDYIITSSGLDAAEVNIGEMIGADEQVIAKGSNIELSASSIINLIGSSTDTANSNKIFINLNGGAYFGKSDSTMFPISEMDMVLSISNGAFIYTDKANSIFALNDSYNASAEINISNADVIADSTSVVGSWSANSCKMFISESTVVGIDLTKGNITLGRYSLINASSLNANKLSVSKDSILVRSSGQLLFDTVSASGYESIADFEKTYYFNIMTLAADDVNADASTRPEFFRDVKIAKVTWLDDVGESYKVTYWVDGSTVDTSAVSAEGFGIDKNATDANNKWFALAYNSWENVNADAGFVVTGDDNKFKPVANKIVEALDVIHVSLDVSDTFRFNVYLPTPDVQGADIVLLGFYNHNGLPITSGVLTDQVVDGTSGWTKLSIALAAEDFSADSVTIRYTVNGTSLQKTIELDILDYVRKVEETHGCGSETKLVYAMLTYKLAEYKAATGNNADPQITSLVEGFIALHNLDCSCPDADYTAPTDETIDYSALEIMDPNVKFAYTLTLNGSQFNASYSFSIYFDKDAIVGELSANGKNFVKYEYDDCIEFRLTDIALADLNDVIEITVGTSTKASYSLATYIANTNSSLAEAMYVISAAAVNE